MKAAIVPRNGQLELRDIPMPEPGPFDCLVKIDACAICTGTDANIIKGTFPWLSQHPFVLGHESTGVILEVGFQVQNFRAGERVTRPAAVLPGESRDGLQSNWGGYAEYGLVRDVEAASAAGVESNAMLSISRAPLPGDVDSIAAALSINQREILSVVRRIPLCADSAVVVIGSGYNGLLFSLFGKHFGAGRVVMVGNPVIASLATSRYRADAFIDYREPHAAACCLENLGAAPTHVIDAVGSMASLAFAQAILSPGSAFGCYGVHDFNAAAPVREALPRAHPPLDMSTDEPGTVEAWYTLWQGGFFAQPGMYDAAMPFVQIHEAFALLARRDAVKIVLET